VWLSCFLLKKQDASSDAFASHQGVYVTLLIIYLINKHRDFPVTLRVNYQLVDFRSVTRMTQYLFLIDNITNPFNFSYAIVIRK
jgi:hypothetical protein